MTDNEIIKALECCIGDTDGKDCFGCPLYEIDDCQAHLNLAALDLINRQKSEIERLRYNLEAVLDERADHSEAIKEFAERLKEKYLDDEKIVNMAWVNAIEHIDNLLKELVGDNCGV